VRNDPGVLDFGCDIACVYYERWLGQTRGLGVLHAVRRALCSFSAAGLRDSAMAATLVVNTGPISAATVAIPATTAAG